MVVAGLGARPQVDMEHQENHYKRARSPQRAASQGVPRCPKLPAMYKRNPLMTALGTAASAPRRNITVASEKRCATRLVTRVSNALTTVLHTRPGR